MCEVVDRMKKKYSFSFEKWSAYPNFLKQFTVLYIFLNVSLLIQELLIRYNGLQRRLLPSWKEGSLIL